jgi:hypothetical protein
LSGGHWIIDITNGHFIHAGPLLKRDRSFYLWTLEWPWRCSQIPSSQDEEDEAFRRRCCGKEGFIALEALRFEDTGTAVAVLRNRGFASPRVGEMLFGHLQKQKLAQRDCLSENDVSNMNLSKQAKHLVLCMWDFNLTTSISAQVIMEHLWITQTLAVTTPCKKQCLNLCHLQYLSMWL